MIRKIENGITIDYGKINWIDQNNVVFGYDDVRHCCEHCGWGVYNPRTRERVADSPDGLPYHFDFDAGAKENDEEPFQGDVTDWVQVVLVSDDDPDKKLILECWCEHNGYYYHDFSFKKHDEKIIEKKLY